VVKRTMLTPGLGNRLDIGVDLTSLEDFEEKLSEGVSFKSGTEGWRLTIWSVSGLHLTGILRYLSGWS